MASRRSSTFISLSAWKKHLVTRPLLSLLLALSCTLGDDSELVDLSMLAESVVGVLVSVGPQCVSDGIIGIVSGTSASAADHAASVLRSSFISLRTEIIAAPPDVLDWAMFGEVRAI